MWIWRHRLNWIYSHLVKYLDLTGIRYSVLANVFSLFGADNDHMTLPNNIRGKENTYSCFFSSIELQFVIIFYHMQTNLTVPDLDHFRRILKNSTESMVTVNTTSPLSRSLIMYSIIGLLHELKMAAYFKKPIA